MRRVVVSAKVVDKVIEIMAYLKRDLYYSDDAVLKYKSHFERFFQVLAYPVDYARCRNRRWHNLGYHCVTVRGWVFAYEIVEGGVIIRDMLHSKLIRDVVD
jgi:hypothetical protein